MWVAELKLKREKSIIVAGSAGFDVTIASYYLNVFEKDNKAFVNKVVLVQGPDKEKYLKGLISHFGKKVRCVEGNQVFYQHESLDAFNAQVMNSEVIFTKPIVGKGGFEYWTIASWDKKHLKDLAKKISKTKGAKVWVLGIREQPIDLFISNVFERLSAKQLAALKKAAAEGYYDFPRKNSLEQIARKAGVDESTFREHLRKAEGAVIKASLREEL
ncbi:MAG: helix-turn-helix domain-containing protein [Candidatus Micrarchaeota archaeon]